MILDKEILVRLINLSSDYFSISKQYVEKDYYSINLLKLISLKRKEIVFKGGTCLSKCFKIINRFSEDIDISLDVNNMSYKEKKNLAHNQIEGSIAELELRLSNPGDIRSRRWFNRFFINYDSVISNNKENIIFELATQAPTYQEEIKECQTFIGEYLDHIGQHQLCLEYGLEKFSLKVQKLERTFVDKIYAICDYQLSKKLTRNSRHLYDLHKILPLINLDSNIVSLFDEIRSYRINNPTCYSAHGDMKLNVLLDDIINKNSFKDDYLKVTTPLLYDNTTYDKCIESLQIIKDFLGKHNL